MSNSLRAKLSKLRYKGEITQEEYSELIKKLDGHDKQVRTDAVEKFADYLRFVYEKSMELSVMGTNDETEKLELKGIYSQFINTIPYCVKAFEEGEQMQKGAENE